MIMSERPTYYSSHKRRPTLVLIIFCLFVFLATTASAQVTFVQVTDPHIFDDDWEEKDPAKTEDNRLDNRAALASCLWYINENIKKGSKYDFGVITGDLGIEFLVKDVASEGDRAVKLETAASDFAAVLALSGVHKWLFVPGNNDVLCEDPKNVHYYHQFISAVSNDLVSQNITVVDLTPQDKSNPSRWDSRSDIVQINGFAFIGFNDSSFKNDPKPDKPCLPADRISINAETQKNYVAQVEDLLKNDNSKSAYIFYHIPEIDDPYFVTLKPDDPKLSTRYANRAVIGESFFDSSWFVKKDVRDEWNKVVMNTRVKGLFAGHFHDNKRQSYLGFQWLRTPNYAPETLSKLHVCPPLALKLQYDKSERARGFEEVYIDDKGEVSTRIVWLNQGIWGLANDVEPRESESLRLLTLGDVYESNGQLKEAEAAYVKAAESTWPPTHQHAMSSAAGVIARQNSLSEKYFFAPARATLVAAATTGGSIVVTFVILAVLLLALTPFARDIGRWRGRNKIRIVATSTNDDLMGAGFEQIIVMIHGRMSSHYSRRHSLLIGSQPLPMLFRSQTGELADLAESVAPGAVAKAIGWLIKRTDSPQYTIAGTIQFPERIYAVRFAGAIFVVLSEKGNTLRTWHKTGRVDDFADEEIRLAFRSLKHLVRHQNP